jgi:flagellar assembly protein FliH
VSSLRRLDPLALPTRELRRLAHVTAVPTTYVSHDVEVDDAEARRALVERQGYDEGYAQGLAEARAEIDIARREESRRVATALSALERAASELRDDASRLRREMQASAPRLAFAILEQLLARELEVSANPGREAIVRALALDEGTSPVSVRLNPDDVARLGEAADLGLDREIVVVADPLIEIGGAVLETGGATLDGQLSTALARVRRVLLGDPEGAGR